MEIIVIVIFLAFISFLFLNGKKKNRYSNNLLPPDTKLILTKNIQFYSQLSAKQKKQFEKRIQHFLNTTKLTGIDTDVDDTDRLLVAASAIIPVFAFPEWEYINLYEVILYPSSFNQRFETGEGNLLGMVGTGYMDGKMILSKPALHAGFRNETDKKNVGIHEFVHLIDKSDGSTDGIPEILLNKQYAIPWLDLVQKEMDNINNAKSDINPYGGIDKSEFFAVISEYFFERPQLLKRKHPEVYKYLDKIFTSYLSLFYKNKKRKGKPNRNDPCICGSDKKFKNCCGKIA